MKGARRALFIFFLFFGPFLLSCAHMCVSSPAAVISSIMPVYVYYMHMYMLVYDMCIVSCYHVCAPVINAQALRATMSPTTRM